MDEFSYKWNLRAGEIVRNRILKHERKYIDFIVSEQPLSKILRAEESDMISTLGWYVNIEYEKRIVQEFLKKVNPELETGRTIIYGCSECGDIGCGAITAEIIDAGDKIIWKDFGYENNYSGFSLDDYLDIPQMEFNKQEYFDVFQKISEDLSKVLRENAV